MDRRNFRTLLASLPLCCAVASVLVACGGSDDGGSKSSSGGSATNGSGGTSSGAGTSNSAGTGSPSGGSNNGNNGGGFDSGLPDDQTLGSLSPSDAQALCDKFDAYFSKGSVATSLHELNCRMAGIFGVVFAMPQSDADAQAACKALYDECVTAPAETTSQCTAPDATCMATAGELEQCLNDSVDALEQASSAIPSCDKLKLADLSASPSDMGMQPAESAACTAVETKCPNGPTLPVGM